jgi:hypothetical protein
MKVGKLSPDLVEAGKLSPDLMEAGKLSSDSMEAGKLSQIRWKLVPVSCPQIRWKRVSWPLDSMKVGKLSPYLVKQVSLPQI